MSSSDGRPFARGGRRFNPLDDPAYSQRNPHQIFLLGLSLLASAGLVKGESGSAVIDQEMTAVVIGWGLALVIGSTMALAGGFWRDLWNGLVLERSGLALVGGAASIYAGLLWFSAANQGDVRYAAAVHIAYACSCFWRCWQITRRLRWLGLQAEAIEGENGGDGGR